MLAGLLAILVLLSVIALLFVSLRRVAQKASSAAEAQATIENALNTVGHGFAYFDVGDRLVLFNDWYRHFGRFPATKGMTFEGTVRIGLRDGIYAETLDESEAWVAERLQRHRNPQGPFELKLGDGRWILVDERRTGDGGRAGLRIDITALKLALEKAEPDQALQASYLDAFRSATAIPLSALADVIALLHNEHRPDRAESRLQTAPQACDLLSGIVGDMLLLSDPSVKHLKQEMAECDTKGLWLVPMNLLQTRVEERSVALVHKAEPNFPERLRGDAARNLQVILLILDYAVMQVESDEVSLALPLDVPLARRPAGLCLCCRFAVNGGQWANVS